MGYIANIIAGVLGVYSFLICLRIILSWFGGGFGHLSGLMIFLQTICDPYLAWWRRILRGKFRALSSLPFDFSVIAAIVFISLVRSVFSTFAFYGKISVGLILALAVGALWSVVSWVLGFIIIILILRLVAELGRFNTYSPFWYFIETVSQPVTDRISRIFFPARRVSGTAKIVVSIVLLLVIAAGLWAVVSFGTSLLRALPF